MRILIENGSHGMRNLGDIAMLQTAVRRLRELWPQSSIEVLTSAPDRLAELCPGVHPVSARGSKMWSREHGLCNAILSPARIRESLKNTWRRTIHSGDLRSFVLSLEQSQLVIAAGGGYINDIFEHHAMQVLTILETAIQSGKVTAMFGQGIGPLQSPQLLAKAAAVFPHVHLIALREKHEGPAILESLGVAPGHVVTTGDDAVEPAYNMRPMQLGTALGINLRLAAYSKTQQNHIEEIRLALDNARAKYDAPLVALPVLSRSKNADGEAIQQLLPHGADLAQSRQTLDAPATLIERIGHCRVVITGSYHAAVFALAQGIPAIGLANSAYYLSKFRGLAGEFGLGCEVILLDEKHLHRRLLSAIDTAYTSAARIRPQLLEAGRKQIAASRRAYQRLHELTTFSQTKP